MTPLPRDVEKAKKTLKNYHIYEHNGNLKVTAVLSILEESFAQALADCRAETREEDARIAEEAVCGCPTYKPCCSDKQSRLSAKAIRNQKAGVV